MFNKKHTCLLPVRVISVISKYLNHHSSCSTCIISDHIKNESMNGNQQGVTPSKFMPLWLFAKGDLHRKPKFAYRMHAKKMETSYPEQYDSENRRYDEMNICLIKEGDIKNTITKLALGFRNFNILITGSLLLYPEDHAGVSFGPKVNPFFEKSTIKLNSSTIAFRQERVKIWEKSIAEKHQPDVFNCRQLSSQFHICNTYNNFRANIFDSNTKQPATIFTLNQLPGTGFGVTADHSSREISLFFDYVYNCINNRSRPSQINDLFKADCKDAKLNQVVKKLKEEASDENLDLLDFLKNKGVSTIAQNISSQVSAANRVLEKNTQDFLSDLCK